MHFNFEQVNIRVNEEEQIKKTISMGKKH